MISSKKENPLLSRQEIEFEVKESNVTPSRKELRQQVAALVNADEKLLVVDVVEQKYGTAETSGNARVYKDYKTLKSTETKKMIIRNFGKEAAAKKKPAAPGQSAGQEAPAAEKK
ncbi:30S ribosomal protein S24e [uncultured archaeon]|nr:30S ribosomal protein S24e [uncultured archaeon]